MKKKALIIIFAVMAVLFVSLAALKWDTIFQRGNPIPYLSAAIKLTDDKTFAAVGNTNDIYITKRGNNRDLFQMIQETHHVEFKDQLGSGYLFSDGENHYIVGSEIYWGNFTVWTLDFDDGFHADKMPTLADVSQMKYNEIRDLLSGKDIREIKEAWGEPHESDVNKSVWQIDESMLLMITYDDHGIVEYCELVCGTPLAPET